ncbi:hypothetical protein BDW02DRAFT_572096 [Decorospora gaudefroyi]|uniref:Uncharacterized protein n=1 Tax=Decorospora gaudefroyi TaxID=184978 RepID=A0A6A5K2S1_9PLEO|nr:hypothetical protein BDW02DRAFT_572096 [Decorospora gaudefroyi]
MHDPEASLLEEGVMFFEDPEIGNRVSEFDEKGSPVQSEEGLDFCQRSTLDDSRVRRTPPKGTLKRHGRHS